MYRFVNEKSSIGQDQMKSFLAYSSVIGKCLERYKIQMTEMDPKNILWTSDGDFMIGGCFGFSIPNDPIKDQKYIDCENVTYEVGFIQSPRNYLEQEIQFQNELLAFWICFLPFDEPQIQFPKSKCERA